MRNIVDPRHARIIAAYCRLSATIDDRLDGVDADLAQLAIGCALARLGVNLTEPPETMH